MTSADDDGIRHALLQLLEANPPDEEKLLARFESRRKDGRGRLLRHPLHPHAPELLGGGGGAALAPHPPPPRSPAQGPPPRRGAPGGPPRLLRQREPRAQEPQGHRDLDLREHGALGGDGRPHRPLQPRVLPDRAAAGDAAVQAARPQASRWPCSTSTTSRPSTTRTATSQGDQVLMKAASLVTQSLREIDIAARYGGEEFARHPARHARAWAPSWSGTASGGAWRSTSGGARAGRTVTMSGGVATFPDDAADLEQLIKRADEALYRSKAQGKNRVTHESAGERRQHPRVAVTHRVTVTPDGRAAAARARNLSEGGAARLRRASPFPWAAPLDVTLRPRGGDPVGVRGEVVRVEARGRAGTHALRPRPALPRRARTARPCPCSAASYRTSSPGGRSRRRYNGNVRLRGGDHRPHPDPFHHGGGCAGRASAGRRAGPAHGGPGASPAPPSAAARAADRARDRARGHHRVPARRRSTAPSCCGPGGRLRRDPADLRRRPRAALRRPTSSSGRASSATWDAGARRADPARRRGPTAASWTSRAWRAGAEAQARTLLGLKSGEAAHREGPARGLRRLEERIGRRVPARWASRLDVEPLAEGVRVRGGGGARPHRVPRAHAGAGPFAALQPGGGHRARGRRGADPVRPVRRSSTRACTAAPPTGSRPTPRASPSAPSARSPGSGSSMGYEFHDLTDTDDIFRRYPLEQIRPGVHPPLHRQRRLFPPARPRGLRVPAPFAERARRRLLAPRPLPVACPWWPTTPVFFFKRGAASQPRGAGRRAGRRPLTAALGGGRAALPDPGGGARLVPGARALRRAAPPRSGRPRGRLVRDRRGEATTEALPTVDSSATSAAATTSRRAFAVYGRLLVGLGTDLPPQRRFALGGAGTLRGYSAQDVQRRRPGAGHGRRPPAFGVAPART